MTREINNCKVLVIGGAGFLGSHLVNHLIEDRNCEVMILDDLSVGRKEFVHKDARFYCADITKRLSIMQVFESFAPDFAFNYAAKPYIPVSFKDPLGVFATNATGALNVMCLCESLEIPLLQVSSAEVYGDANGAIDENHPICAHSTYGAAKVAADALVQTRCKEGRLKAIALRQFNCVGERETHPYVIPEIISQLRPQKGRRVATVKLGNNSRRDFIYAGDAVRIATILLEKGEFGEVYNLGSEHSVTIYDLARMIGEIMGFEDTEIQGDDSRRRPWEIWHLHSNNTKLWNAIGVQYAILTTLEEALRKTIESFEEGGQRWCWEPKKPDTIPLV